MKEKKSFKLLKEVVLDIHAGHAGADLMTKYDMSADELQGILKTISIIKNATAADLYGRSPSDQAAEALNIIRMLPRTKLFVQLPIEDPQHVERLGVVYDISEKGVGVEGIEAEVDEAGRFVVRPDGFFDLDPFLFDAKCRWVRREGPGGKSLSGFEITYISPEDLEKLKNLITAVVNSIEEIAATGKQTD
jgi:hypothetical protein